MSFADKQGQIPRSDFENAAASLDLYLTTKTQLILLLDESVKQTKNGNDFLRGMDEAKKLSGLEMRIEIKLIEHCS